MVCAAVLATMLTSSACRNMPGPFAPPVQRQPLQNFRPYRMSSIVNMSDEDARTHFVQDITSLEAATWRWTGKRPTVRVRMRSAENIRYTIDFAIAEATLLATGPVTVTFLVNDRVLDHARYRRAGNQHFEKPIPAGWVIAGEDVTVGAEVDKLWVSPDDGPKLGMILVRIGLTQ
ncbi:MAG: hypothetical protein JWO19_4299 [Bryobacterales bacterium]|jgi:hypothetical protein|nr:hypothetical protein [Bryobacterales bacterium]